jgi:two-component system sensor histidine kinase DesK
MSPMFGWPRDGIDSRPSRARQALWGSIGLAYLVPVLRHVLGQSGSARVLGLLALAAFVGTYVATIALRGPWTGRSRPITWVLLVVLTGLALGLPIVADDAWIGLPIYLSLIYATTLPMRWALWGVVAAAATTCAQSLWLGERGNAVVTLTITSLSIGCMMLGFRHARTLVAQLQEARGEVARLAATEERLRIARDLHDLLGHSLSLIVLKSELAGRVAEVDPAGTVREVRDIESVARQALADVREAVSGYRRRGLAEELDNARAVLAAAQVAVTVRTAGTPLPDHVDGLFGWAVREGVTNVVRHAGARRCAIEVSRDGGCARLEIRDDGADTGAYALGSGLTGLTERVRHCGGSVRLGRAPEGGFGLVVQTPLERPAAVGSQP